MFGSFRHHPASKLSEILLAGRSSTSSTSSSSSSLCSSSSSCWEQGWRSGDSTRLPSMWPGFKCWRRAICGLSLLLVFPFAPRGFSPGTLVFPLSSKTNISKFQFDQENYSRRTTKRMCYLFVAIYLFIVIIDSSSTTSFDCQLTKVSSLCSCTVENLTMTVLPERIILHLFKGAVSRQSSSFCLILPITRPQSLWNLK